MYSIKHETKKGGSGVTITRDYDELVKNVCRLFKQHLEATIYLNNKVVGKVFKDNSQRLGWNYFIEKDN